jgi:SSS family solute:Na+ symporter
MAIAAGIKPSNPNFAVPDLFIQQFPSWFTGFAFAAIAIGALVPAAVMSIAAANLFTRNVWREFVRPDCSDAEQARVAKLASLFVKLGALVFVLALPTDYAIDLQLLGGVWILQTLPSVALGLYTRWFNRWALLVGWAAGMTWGTILAADASFKGSVATVHLFGGHLTAYWGLFAIVLNLVVTTVLTLVLPRDRAVDETTPEDYVSEAEARPLPATPEEEPRFTREPVRPRISR